MSSFIKRTLESIDLARRNAITNARIAGYEVSNDASLNEISNLFLQEPTEPSEPDRWVRPSDWWDCRTILEEAENIVDDGITYYPAYIVLLDDYEDSTTFTKNYSVSMNSATYEVKLQYSGVKTSDGAWFTDDNHVHTWDKTKDKECIEGYKTRYFIVYMTSTTNVNNIVIGRLFPILEIIFGNISFASNVNLRFGATNDYGNIKDDCNYALRNIETLTTTRFDSNTLGSYSSNIIRRCSQLEHLYFPTLEKFTYIQNVLNYQLKDIDIPNATAVSASSGTLHRYATYFSYKEKLLNSIDGSNYNLTYALSCPIFTNSELTFPNLESFSNAIYAGDYVKKLNFPKIDSLSISLGTFTEQILADNATSVSINSSGSQNCVKELIFPKATTFSCNNSCPCCTKIDVPMCQKLTITGGLPSLREFTVPSTVQILNNPSAFLRGCYALNKLTLFTGWKFSGCNWSDLIQLSHDSLVDILNKLADVTEESGTYTLTLGATNLAKLTAEEIAIGTNKGWTIS